MKRSTRVLASAAVAAIALDSTAAPPGQARDFDEPRDGYAPRSTVLRTATPEGVGLLPDPIEQAKALVRSREQGEKPLYPGAVGLMAHDGRIVATDASGWARLYADATTLLPPDQRVPMRSDTIFDMASVSKLFTSIVVVQLLEQDRIELEAPVSRYLPEFAGQGKQDTTVRQLLTHTSGLPAWLPLWSA